MKDFPKNTISFYIKYAVKPFFWTLLVWFVLAVSWRLLNGILLPYLQKLFISLFEQPDSTLKIFLPVVIFITVTVVGGHIIHLFDDILWVRLRTKVFNHLSQILTDYVHNQSMAFWANRIIGKTNEQITFLAKGFDSLVTLIIVFTAFLIVVLNFGMVLDINNKIGLIFGIAIAFYFIHCLLNVKRLGATNKLAAKSYSSLMGQLIDSLSNFMIVKLFTGQNREKEHVKFSRDKYENDKIYAGMIMRFFWGVPSIVWGVLFGYMLYRCVDLYLIKEITVADIVFILTVNNVIMHNISFIVMNMTSVSEIIGSSVQSYKELIVPITVKDAINAKNLVVKKGRIDISDVRFAYENKKVLDGISFSVKAGEKIGLVGTSGAGKSTLVNLIMRLYDPQKGRIFIDGQNIKDVTQESLRRNIAFIPQDTNLFNRSIKDNIAYGKADATIEEVIEAAQKASADNFIKETPNGYDTLVGDRGIKLSGGQRQRIAIARAFLKDAPILILDEATAALDSETEIAIQKSFDELAKNRTTIVIAHRLSTLRNMDRIIVLDKGRIVEVGTHNSLSKKKNGLYCQLWKMQSGGFIPE